MVAGAACLAGCGGSSSSSQGSPSLTSRNVTGVVINYSTGLAVPAPTLALSNQTVTGGNDGTFTLTNVQRTNQTLTVSAFGYETYQWPLLATEDQITVPLVPGTPTVQPPPNAYRAR
jgi:hypothetical protein